MRAIPRLGRYYILLLFAFLCCNACTTVKFNTIPPPPPSAKLHVAVLTITGKGGKSGWALPHQKWSARTYAAVSRHLRETGIYEVISAEKMRYAVGKQTLSTDEYWWLKDDCALLKQYGKALHADYAMILTRYAVLTSGQATSSYKYDVKLINIETGKRFSAFDYLVNTRSKELNIEIGSKEMYPRIYKKLFAEAKSDLLATAMQKSRQLPAEEPIKPPAPSPQPPALPEKVKETTSKPAPLPEAITPKETPKEATKPPSSPPQPLGAPETKEVPAAATGTMAAAVPPAPLPESAGADNHHGLPGNLRDNLTEKEPTDEKARLVVYDFQTSEKLQVASLILSDALREELFLLGSFALVNRENLVQVMQELSLQQSGLVDEKQVVKLGKWLAANEAVTGRLAALGNSYILQAKRTDITTMGTLGLGSLKCSAGQEEELLAGMRELARKLAGFKK